MSYVSELDFEKTLHKHATMISDDFDFLSPKYTLIYFLSIGNAYFSFTVVPCYNAVVGVHEMEPRCKRDAL